MIEIDTVEESYFATNGVVLGKLIKASNECREAQLVIQFNWDLWKSCGEPSISGINEDAHKEFYYRDYPPYLLTQRTPDPRRTDIQDIIRRENLPSYDQFDFMCFHFGLTGNDRFVFARGLRYYIALNGDMYVDDGVPWELQRPLPPASEYSGFKQNFDVFITGGYNLIEAAKQGFNSWRDCVHKIDLDLGLRHPYPFKESLWK